MLSRTQKIKVWRRELLIRLSQFKFFILLLIFSSTIGMITLWRFMHLSLFNALYESIALLFFASSISFPKDPILQIMWIVYPLMGITLIGSGLGGIGASLNLSDTSSIIWNREVAKVINNHIIIIGIGNVGFKVLKSLVEREHDIVVIDLFDKKGREEEFREFQKKYKIPLIRGDAYRETILREANIETAYAVLILIDEDLLNLKIASRIRDLNKSVKLIVRLFDIEFGEKIYKKLDIDEIISTSSIAIPYFIDKLNH